LIERVEIVLWREDSPDGDLLANLVNITPGPFFCRCASKGLVTL